MKITVGQLKEILREELKKMMEDTDRLRRHAEGYGDEKEESVDRVKRHEDGYGDSLFDEAVEEEKPCDEATDAELDFQE